MADAGCQCVYVVDSAGAMILDDASERVAAVVAELGDDAQVGFHGHENLSLSLANTIAAIQAGAVQVDGSTRRFGAGSGNTSCEAIAAVTERIGINTGLDVLKMIDAAEDVVRPVMDEECVLDRLSLIMGYAGRLLQLPQARLPRLGALRSQSGADILMECGNRKLVGGQEDQIIQIAAQMAAEQPGRQRAAWPDDHQLDRRQRHAKPTRARRSRPSTPGRRSRTTRSRCPVAPTSSGQSTLRVVRSTTGRGLGWGSPSAAPSCTGSRT